MLDRILKAPGIHFAAIGGLLFVISQMLAPTPTDFGPIQQLGLSAHRLDQAHDAFLAKHHRAPDAEERAGIIRRLVDEEILLRHALALGMDEQETVQRRLAQIARFVASGSPATDFSERSRTQGDPKDTSPQGGDDLASWAAEAKRLGLHLEDTVVRRILVDSARRLIRGAALRRELSDEVLRSHLANHADRYRLPAAVAFDWHHEADAATAAKSMPPLTLADLERRFGRDFADRLADRIDDRIDGPGKGQWQGPLPSRNGPILIRVTSHLAERTASLEEVERQVRREVSEILAERWLQARLKQLRNGVEVQLPGHWRVQTATGPVAQSERRSS